MPPFFDTNVLVYTVDEDEPEKGEISRRLVDEYLVRGDGIISVQVLREFYSAARKLRRPLSDEKAQEMVRYLSTFSPIPEDAGMVVRAVERSRSMSFSFWDALIIESALWVGADRLLTEDLQHGQEIEDLRVENPFL
jgi:predicted nucleic acid-binding protein